MTHYQHWSLVRRWPYIHFAPEEIASKGGGSLLVDHDALTKLDKMRDLVGRPFIITSAYRDPIHNAKVGGAPMSMHKFGKAFDILLRGHDKDRLIEAAKIVGFGGIGASYKTFLHVDTGRKRRW